MTGYGHHSGDERPDELTGGPEYLLFSPGDGDGLIRGERHRGDARVIRAMACKAMSAGFRAPVSS
jgi:hypothetical protein